MIIAVAAEKGGVGKTTTSVHLAVGLAAQDKTLRILVVDLDSQGHASFYLGFQDRSGEALTNALLDDEPLVPVTTEFGVDLIEGGRQLALASTELAQRPMALTRLRDTLRAFTADYDHIIIDSPPELGVITQNVLIASDAVVIPVQCMSIALLGMYDLLQTIEELREEDNQDLYVLGFVPTMVHGRTNHARQVVEHLNTEYEGQTSPSINHSIVFAESMGYATPIYTYSPDSRGAQDYRAVCDWFSQRI